ncbi:MAG: NTP transferase domain-containing protein [Pseudomonadota bacterium]|nr:NTP transferase domain-containing protein [Pseudomonadota bacterium]MDE3036879.1 NTP transferase domain-containing protein [Pseudomonadota bacterium]
MQAIILAGGFGTRLPLDGGMPKPMAPVAGRPFLHWLLDFLLSQGVTEAVLCLHHRHEIIREYFGETFDGMRLRYYIEEQARGTGGAIAAALAQLAPREPVLALNGDSLVQLDYRAMLAAHARAGRRITMAAHRVEDCGRASKLTVHNGEVLRFELLGGAGGGIISAGFYVLSPDVFDGFTLPDVFSFERDFLSPHVPSLLPAAYEAVEYFIDIGTPEDYARAQTEVPQRMSAPYLVREGLLNP